MMRVDQQVARDVAVDFQQARGARGRKRAPGGTPDAPVKIDKDEADQHDRQRQPQRLRQVKQFIEEQQRQHAAARQDRPPHRAVQNEREPQRPRGLRQRDGGSGPLRGHGVAPVAAVTS